MSASSACRDCLHCHNPDAIWLSMRCAAEVFVSPSTGHHRMPLCDNERDDCGACGPEAKRWESRIDESGTRDEPLRLQIEAQIAGFRSHLCYLTQRHRRIETNTRRAMGHAHEAVRLALKLRRLYGRKQHKEENET